MDELACPSTTQTVAEVLADLSVHLSWRQAWDSGAKLLITMRKGAEVTALAPGPEAAPHTSYRCCRTRCAWLAAVAAAAAATIIIAPTLVAAAASAD